MWSPGAACPVCAAGGLQCKPKVYKSSVAEESLHTARHVGGVSCFEGVEHELCSAVSKACAPHLLPSYLLLSYLDMPATALRPDVRSWSMVTVCRRPPNPFWIRSCPCSRPSPPSDQSGAALGLCCRHGCTCVQALSGCLGVRGMVLECFDCMFQCSGTAVSLLGHTHMTNSDLILVTPFYSLLPTAVRVAWRKPRLSAKLVRPCWQMRPKNCLQPGPSYQCCAPPR